MAQRVEVRRWRARRTLPKLPVRGVTLAHRADAWAMRTLCDDPAYAVVADLFDILGLQLLA
jgi:hypothetical protein